MIDEKERKQSKNQHPYGPTLAYIDSQISGAGKEYFDKLFQIVGICAEGEWHNMHPFTQG